MVTGQGSGLGIGGCDEWCPAANRALLGCIVSLSVMIKDYSLHLGGSQVTDLFILGTYWWMWARKTCYPLVMGSGSIRTN
jgi:hypothetical protein